MPDFFTIFSVLLLSVRYVHGLPCQGDYLEKEITNMKERTSQLLDQVMMQQFAAEEYIRATGSGMRQVRQSSGINSYLHIHDRCDKDGEVALGELDVVMNGIEFKTRHNSYRLVKPLRSFRSPPYDEIPSPEVPQQVLEKTTATEQIEEMREYFKAWKDSNSKHRLFRDHFRPVLCYLEGAWMKTSDSISNSIYNGNDFGSADWEELIQSAQFGAYANYQDNLGRIPFLPSALTEVKDYNNHTIAQWDYRIMCHSIVKFLPLTALRLVDDLEARMRLNLTLSEYEMHESAHFDLHDYSNAIYVDESKGVSLWDLIMSRVPGMDGYRASLKDDLFGENRLDDVVNDSGELNAAYYHRWYKADQKNMDGVDTGARSFNDHNLYMAMTTRDDVIGTTIGKNCSYDENNVRVCQHYETQKWSYALPLEIIYLTPLHKWNPFDLTNHKENHDAVQDSGRNGALSQESAFNGVSNEFFFMTPAVFYGGPDGQETGVLNSAGDVVTTRCSGIQTILPDIPGLGKLRTRFPIMRRDVDGDPVWKELSALKQMIMNSYSYTDMIGGVTEMRETHVTLEMPASEDTSQVPTHTHLVKLTKDEAIYLKHPSNIGKCISAYTTYDEGHSHALRVKFDHFSFSYYYSRCDGLAESVRCDDSHDFTMNILEDNSDFATADNRPVSFSAVNIKRRLQDENIYDPVDQTYHHNLGLIYNRHIARYEYIGCTGERENLTCTIFDVPPIDPILEL